VANRVSDSVSVIDGTINDVVATVTFNIHSLNAGHIKCNNNDISTNIYLRIRPGTPCKAEANSGFVFSSWSENLGHNSSKTIITSPISDSWTSLLHAIGFLNDNSTFKISEHGNFVANFRQSPSPVPPEYLTAIFVFILSVLVPSIYRGISGYNTRRNLCKYLAEEIDSNSDRLDQDTRRKKITELYTEGKITTSQRKILEEKISQHYKSVSDITHIEKDESITTTSSTTKEYDKSRSAKKSATETIQPLVVEEEESNHKSNVDNKETKPNSL
jgi:hypothetical protein